MSERVSAKGSGKRESYLDSALSLYQYFDEVDNEYKTSERVSINEYLTNSTRYDSVSAVYQRADRIISNREVSVSVIKFPEGSEEAKVPCSNDGLDITINADLVKDIDNNTILNLKGLNYHELGHILFTPRAGSDLGRWVTENKVLKAFNLLEDNRTDNMLISRYPSTKPFLESNVAEYILNDPDTMASHFPTISGRNFLPVEIRQLVLDKFISEYGADLAREVSSVTNEYSTLVFPRDFDRAKELIMRMTNIIGKAPTKSPHDDRPVPRRGRPANGDEQDRLQDTHKKHEHGYPNPKFDNTPKPSEGKDNKDNKPKNTDGDNGYGNTDTDTDTEADDLVSALNDLLTKVKNDPSVKREVNETRKSIVDNTDSRSVMGKIGYLPTNPSNEAVVYARKFANELERLVRDSDPKWDTHNASGRLNIDRTMNPDINAINELFDRWDMGNEATDIEAVILLDNSASMNGRLHRVSEVGWILKRGIEKVEGSVSIFTFASESKILYERSERALPNTIRAIADGGNTDPTKALIEAKRLLATSTKPIKLLLIVTDGEWSNANICDDLIKDMGDSGVVTSVVFLGHYENIKKALVEAQQHGDTSTINYLTYLRHNAQSLTGVRTPKDILIVASDLIKSLLTLKQPTY